MTNSDRMQELYARFDEAGVSREYLQDFVLPDWWQDGIADDPGGYLEGLTFIAKHLGIDLETLRDADSSLSAQTAAEARFKLRANVDSGDVSWAQSVAVRAAEMASLATPIPPQATSDLNASGIREDILAGDAEWVGLDSLLRYCWESGVPVLHIPEVPGNKMDGMVIRAGDRPVIVLSIDHKHEARLLFILAHELGHIIEGHLDSEDVVVDDDYDPAPADEREHEYNSTPTDPREKEANRFAVELITGDPEFKARLTRYFEASELAEIVTDYGTSEKIAPGAIILNVAYYDPDDPWGLAHATLNKLDPDPDAPQMIRSQIEDYLDWKALPEESAEFLARITGIAPSTEPAVAAK